jgi:hypothetical protein
MTCAVFDPIIARILNRAKDAKLSGGAYFECGVVRVFLFFAAVSIPSLAAAPAHAMGELSLPVWEEIFQPNGDLVDEVDSYGFAVAGGNGVPDYRDRGDLDAVFIEDVVSDDVATDMSVRSGAEALDEDVVYNDTVTAAHDLGNVHILARRDAVDDLQLYAGVELLSPLEGPAPDTYVEFEFTQEVVQAIGAGSPIRGERTDGDLLVRVTFAGGAIASVSFERWVEGVGHQAIDAMTISPDDPAACHGGATPYVFCLGAPPIAAPEGGFEVWDLDGNIVPSVDPDGYLEIGLDVAALLGANPEFTSVVIRTPEDIVLGGFRRLGHWATVLAMVEE